MASLHCSLSPDTSVTPRILDITIEAICAEVLAVSCPTHVEAKSGISPTTALLHTGRFIRWPHAPFLRLSSHQYPKKDCLFFISVLLPLSRLSRVYFYAGETRTGPTPRSIADSHLYLNAHPILLFNSVSLLFNSTRCSFVRPPIVDRNFSSVVPFPNAMISGVNSLRALAYVRFLFFDSFSVFSHFYRRYSVSIYLGRRPPEMITSSHIFVNFPAKRPSIPSCSNPIFFLNCEPIKL